jgi:hypothetical protein
MAHAPAPQVAQCRLHRGLRVADRSRPRRLLGGSLRDRQPDEGIAPLAVSLILGCDPGATGAIAFLTPSGDLLAVEDIPVDKIAVGKGKRSRVAIPRLLALLRGAAGAHAFIEQPQYRPMRKPNAQTGVPETSHMGVAGAGAFGETYGAILACMVASGCAVTEVRPGVWGRSIGLKGGKDDARRMAGNLFPASSGLFARVMDHNRADGALLGYYGSRVLRGGGREAA